MMDWIILKIDTFLLAMLTLMNWIIDTPLGVLICLLLSVALMTLLERLFFGKFQRRFGPDQTAMSGILQPIADACKLAFKEPFKPKNSNEFMFIFAPVLTLILSLILWTFISFDDTVLATNPSIAMLFILGLSGLTVLTIFTAGWASNSRFAFLGALRAVAQMVAYELCLGTVVISMCFLTGCYSINEFSIRQEEMVLFIPFFFNFQLFLIAILAETNRHPFDLPEAEAELVSGYNVEYSGMRFAFFFLAEYANILFMSALTVIIFLGGWQPMFDLFLFELVPPAAWFSIKLTSVVFFFTLVRAAYPRFRYDQLMTLIWKRLLPMSLGLFLVYVSIGLCTGTIPPFF